MKGPSLYAFKGLAGRFAPIGVHLAMLLIMGGATLSATGSFHGSVTVPQGLNFVVGDVLAPSGFLSTPTPAFNNEVHVNRFYMDYYSSGEVKPAEFFVLLLQSLIHCLTCIYISPIVWFSSKFYLSFVMSRWHSSILIFHCSTLMGRKS